MELLPELFCLICEYADISSIRIFHRTSKRFHELGKKYIKRKFLKKNPLLFGGFVQHNCQEKYTVELALDGFEIPASHYVKGNRVICSVLAHLGRLDLLKEAVAKGCKVQWDTPVIAARSNHIDIIKFCRNYIKLDWNIRYKMAGAAAGKGHLAVLEYLAEKDGHSHIETIIDEGLLGGHLHILQWIKNYNKISWKGAVEYGHLHIVEWGVENNYIDTAWILLYAIKRDKFRILKWVLDQGHHITDEHYIMAVKNDATDIIEHILTDIALVQRIAARYDKKKILRQLVDSGQTIDESIFAIAVENKSNKVIKWMIHKDILTKQIQVNDYLLSDNAIMNLLLARDLVHLDNSACRTLIGCGYFRAIESKLDAIPKSPYHFSIGNGIITKLAYSTDVGHGQKLFCLNNDGQFQTSELDHCDCWWYLLACVEGNVSVDKVKMCDLHRGLDC